MRLTGKIIKWNEKKAFGFIEPEGGGKNVFIHKSALVNKSRTPQINDVITYSTSKDKQGKFCADKVTFAGEKLTSNKATNVNKFSLYLSALFFVLMITASFLGDIPNILVIVYIVMSIVTFSAYALDKSKAKRGVWRTSESSLHLLSLIGGWPGAAIAQQLLRHKSKKSVFRIVFWITVICNLGILYWLLALGGTELMIE